MPEGRVDLCLLLAEIQKRKPKEGFDTESASIIQDLESFKTNGNNHIAGRLRLKFAIGALAQGVLVGIVTDSEYRQSIICGLNL